MKYTCILFLFAFLSSFSFAQNDEYVNENFERNYDYVYKDYIKTVRLHLKELEISYPVIELNSNAQLQLSFDDLSGEDNFYFYTVQLCNADWTPSELNDMEYLESFTFEEIRDFEYSANTLQDYTNYWIDLPNDDVRWTKSGNYLLKVYLDDDLEDLVLTKRFMVTENAATIVEDIGRASDVGNIRSHQEIDLEIRNDALNIKDPKREVEIAILKNGRWDNAIMGIDPLFVSDNVLNYDYQGKMVFPAGKEFRNIDLRSVRFRGSNIESIESSSTGYEIEIDVEQPRRSAVYRSDIDINGKYIIQNFQEDDSRIEAEYVWATFNLEMPLALTGGNIYLFGQLSNWNLLEEFKMTYNPETGTYQLRTLIKQGYYNYMYAFEADGKSNIADLSKIEGDWYQTENDFLTLVYYRPIGERYDRIVAAKISNSNR